MKRSRFVVYLLLFCLFLTVALLSAQTVSWATPSQSHVNQTVPTPTPESMAITLTVTLQRPNAPPPDSSWAVPVHLAFYPPGDPNTIRGEWDLTLNDSGQWSGGLNLASGTYDVRARNLHTLRNVKRNVAVAEGATINMGTLREGDADGDNKVRAPDFAILRASYFKKEGDAGFDPRADFDEDQRVRSSDFALLRSNYFSGGDIEVTSALVHAAVSRPQSLVDLALEPASVAVEAGDIFTLTLVAHAGTQPFVAMDTRISFPAANLQVVGPDGLPAAAIESLSSFGEMINSVDNSQGEILYGIYSFTTSLSGDVSLARMRFKVIAPANRMRIDLIDATVSDDAGRDVLGNLSGSMATSGSTTRLIYLPIIIKAP